MFGFSGISGVRNGWSEFVSHIKSIALSALHALSSMALMCNCLSSLFMHICISSSSLRSSVLPFIVMP